MSAAPFASFKPSAKGLPVSRVNHFDNTSAFFLIKSDIFLIILDLSHGEVFFHFLKPSSEDLKDKLISVLFAFDALPITSSVAGLITS